MRPENASRLAMALLSDETPEGLPQVEGYRVEAELGRGAGGVVYRATSLTSGRPVALKLLHAQAGARTDRAWREVEMLSQIRSPNVVQVLDYGLAGGRLYIATGLVEGRPLLEHARAQGLDRRARVSLLARITDAVQTLHEHGVIHRDLKPSNILISEHEEPVIIDLGIAALVSQNVMQTLTAEGAPIGTPAYMAPEQARGDRASISTRSDVYALGAIGYHLLTGQTPHEMSETIYESVRRVGEDEPRPGRALDPSLPRALESVLLRACARRARDRYESSAAFGKDLRRWLRREPVSAGRQRPWTRVTRWATRHPLLTTLGLCASILTGTVGLSYAAVWWLNGKPHSIVVMGRGETVQIRSRSGRVIREFRSTEGTPYRVASVGRDATGSPEYFVISVKSLGSVSDLPTGLHVFRAHALDAPAWSFSPTSVPAALRPAADRTPAGDIFLAHAILVADVLEAPGPEIISVHCHDPFSPAAIAIHTPEGQLLDLVWHDGRLESIAAFPESGLIVCAGVNSERAFRTSLYGTPLPTHHPATVFAYHGQSGRSDGIIAIDRTLATEPTEWAYRIDPVEATQRFKCSRDALLAIEREAGPILRLMLDLIDESDGSVTFFIDRDGEWTRGYPNDGYRIAPERMPFEGLGLAPLTYGASSSNSSP
jgi:serine/threonine protein kinase